MKKIIFFILFLTCHTCSFGSHIMLEGKYTSKKYFPSTSRTFRIYVPEQYKGTEPASLFLGFDGVKCNAPNVFDTLIAQGKMPVTIGVFLSPGTITDGKGHVLRYNRSNEFDMTDDRLAKFIEEELLPEVEKMRTPDQRQIRLSREGKKNLIFGSSSGGIAAFVAAWQRPDLFGRVFSAIGTFVPMRGGQNMQVMVRKTEPKPLRVFLQDGSNDAWNPLFGSWYEANRMMASALQFSGYQCAFDWSDGEHNGKRAGEIFSKVMEWLWQGWPDEIKPGKTQNDMLDSLLIPENRWLEKSFNLSKDKKRQLPKGLPKDARKVFVLNADNTLLVCVRPGTNCLWQYIVAKETPFMQDKDSIGYTHRTTVSCK